jgi:hypothetical protein
VLVQKWKLSRNHIILITCVSVFLFALFPGKGGLEGDQRDIVGMSNRSDNWGFIVPFLVGNWPNFWGHWRFSLVVLQLILFWVGLWLLLKRSWDKNNRGMKIVIIGFTFFSSIFVSQLWRDATLLGLSTFGLGLLSKASSCRSNYKYALIFSSLLMLHFAAMFKVLYGTILGFFFLWILIQDQVKRRFFIFPSLAIAISLAFTPYLLDKQLTKIAGLQKVFPEQQPMIFDLASSYCWGPSDQLVADAAKGLELVKRPGFPLQSICASLRPTSWDNLHSSPYQWQFNSPIIRITGDQEDKVTQLRNKWISMIINNPIDWAQVRLMYLGWTLTLSNSFVPQNDSNTWGGLVGELNKVVWSGIYNFASAVDKLRLSSILWALLIILVLILRAALISLGNKREFYFHARDQFVAVGVLLGTTGLTIFGFVASNGRYVLPYVLLTYLMLLKSKGSIRNKQQDQHQP